MFREDLPGSLAPESTFSFNFDVTFRHCRREDLRDLEWFGMFYAHRQLIEAAFARQVDGENLMLLAEVNRFPIGQVWIDLAKKRAQRTGLLWALRVLPVFQGQGLGTRLIAEGEAFLQNRGFSCAEITVEKNNPQAKKLYLRLGYKLIGTQVEQWDYVTPEGQHIQAQSEEWVLQKTLPYTVSLDLEKKAA